MTGTEVKVNDKRKFGGNLWSAERKILARAFELKAAQELQSLLREKIAVLPETSSDQIKPFQIDAHDLFRAVATAETSLADLKVALRRYTGATGYQMAIGLDESVRYRLDGSVDALVSEDNREHARTIVKGRFSKMRQSQTGAKDNPIREPANSGT